MGFVIQQRTPQAGMTEMHFIPLQPNYSVHGGMQLVSFIMCSYPIGFIMLLGSVSVVFV
jgi:hypothetical protein